MTEAGGDGLTTLDAMIARLRALGAGAREAVAKEGAPLVEAAARKTAAAGTDPWGEPWRSRKDGARAIPEAASAIDCVARGSVVTLRVHGGAATQNGLPESTGRQVIPDITRPLPDGIVAALREAMRRVFTREESR